MGKGPLSRAAGSGRATAPKPPSQPSPALGALGAGEQPVVIVGYSMGGEIALDAQIANPEMIAGTALVYGFGYEEAPHAALQSPWR